MSEKQWLVWDFVAYDELALALHRVPDTSKATFSFLSDPTSNVSLSLDALDHSSLHRDFVMVSLTTVSCITHVYMVARSVLISTRFNTSWNSYYWVRDRNKFPHIAQPHIHTYNKAISCAETFISILHYLFWTIEGIVWMYCISSTLCSTHTSWPWEDLSNRDLCDSKRFNWSTSTHHTNFYLHSFRKSFSKQGSSSWIIL